MTPTQEYIEQLKLLHKKKSFGVNANIPGIVVEYIEKNQVTSLLDFGCGKGHALETFRQTFPELKCIGYDPAREDCNVLPESVDFIYSADVLEHIEPDQLDDTLNDLYRRANKGMYHLIACHPAKKELSDGRNAHLIIEPPDWWKKKLQSLGWNITYDFVKDAMTKPKKGPPKHVVKYAVLIEK